MRAEYETTISWRCGECTQDFAHQQFLAHLPAVHKMTGRSGTKELVLHLDFADGSSSVYEWQLGDVHGTQTVTTRKVKKTVK